MIHELDLNELDAPIRKVEISAALPDAEHLRWQCRRGLLELDYLLEHFLEHAYPTLVPDLKQAFVKLLTYPDPVLQAWMTGDLKPEDETINSVVKLLQSTRL